MLLRVIRILLANCSTWKPFALGHAAAFRAVSGSGGAADVPETFQSSGVAAYCAARTRGRTPRQYVGLARPGNRFFARAGGWHRRAFRAPKRPNTHKATRVTAAVRERPGSTAIARPARAVPRAGIHSVPSTPAASRRPVATPTRDRGIPGAPAVRFAPPFGGPGAARPDRFPGRAGNSSPLRTARRSSAHALPCLRIASTSDPFERAHRAAQPHGVALHARYLHRDGPGIAGQAEIVLHAELGGILHRLQRRATRGGQTPAAIRQAGSSVKGARKAASRIQGQRQPTCCGRRGGGPGAGCGHPVQSRWTSFASTAWAQHDRYRRRRHGHRSQVLHFHLGQGLQAEPADDVGEEAGAQLLALFSPTAVFIHITFVRPGTGVPSTSSSRPENLELNGTAGNRRIVSRTILSTKGCKVFWSSCFARHLSRSVFRQDRGPDR